jgi:streptogramin lyase
MFVAGAASAWSASPTATAGRAEDSPVQKDANPQIDGPSDIATGPDGNLWFTSSGNDRIGRITPSGEITTFRDPAGKVRAPTGITAGPDEGVWFTNSDNNRIGRIASSGSITTFKDRDGRIREPTDITMGPDRMLWFTSTKNDRIGRVAPAGKFSIFEDRRGVDYPLDITAGPDGNVWFTEQAGNRIGRIDPATGTITEFPLPNPNSQPWEVTGGPDGNLWFTEFSGNRIGRISPDGIISELAVPTPASQPNTIRRGPDLNPGDNCAYQRESLGAAAFRVRYGSFGGCVARLATTETLWFTETAANRVAQVTTDGDIFEYAIPTAVSQPIGITHGPDGAVWFAEFAANTIGRLDVKTVGKPIAPGVRADDATAFDPTELGE